MKFFSILYYVRNQLLFNSFDPVLRVDTSYKPARSGFVKYFLVFLLYDIPVGAGLNRVVKSQRMILSILHARTPRSGGGLSRLNGPPGNTRLYTKYSCLFALYFYYQGITPVAGFVSSLINLPVTPSLSNKAYFTIRFPASSTSPPLLPVKSVLV